MKKIFIAVLLLFFLLGCLPMPYEKHCVYFFTDGNEMIECNEESNGHLWDCENGDEYYNVQNIRATCFLTSEGNKNG